MAAKELMRSNKTSIQETLCADYMLILNKAVQNNLITSREYNNLKGINRLNEEGHVVEFVDKVMNKGEETCQAFLTLLQTDDEIQQTYPQLKNMLKKETCLLPYSVQACSDENTESLAEVFSWLRFRVLMCKDQTKDQMKRVLECFASQCDPSLLKEFNVKEWTHSRFIDLQEAPKHGDAFICCVLSHGNKGVVFGIDDEPLAIKEITKTFMASHQSPLTDKPKVFLIQACQGVAPHPGVLLKDLQGDNPHPIFIPQESDVLVNIATVEDCEAFRNIKTGSWFIQSVCKQLKEGCPRNEEIEVILRRVNNEVAQKEGSSVPGARKQMPEIRHTLRKRLVLTPHRN
ncbi:caspase-8-like isoform X2 [Eleginops maclovinus]|uniref:caspase-8-like isoform X2 n=1 Tax=Eleginops maclovinus TaxID=56733 RepID=UPI00307FF28B